MNSAVVHMRQLGALHLPPLSLVAHGIGDLHETGNVGTGHEGWDDTALSKLCSSLPTSLVTSDHDVLELCVDLCWGPSETLRVLGHFETRDGDTTTVGSLSGSVEDDTVLLVERSDGLSGSLKDVDGLLGTTHVGTLGNVSDTGAGEGLGLFLGNLVLGGRRESDIGRLDKSPWSLALVVLESRTRLESRERLSGELDVGNGGNVFGGESLGVLGDEGTGRVGEGEDGTTELNDLEGGVLGDVTRSRDQNLLAVPVGVVEVLEHLGNVVDETVSGSLGTDERTTPRSTLTGKDTGKLVSDLLVGTEHETNLTSTGSDITGRDIGVVTNVSRELLHERVALGISWC